MCRGIADWAPKAVSRDFFSLGAWPPRRFPFDTKSRGDLGEWGNQGNGNTENVSVKFCRSRLPLLGRLCPGLAISLGSIVKSTDRSPSISSNRVAHALTDRGGTDYSVVTLFRSLDFI